MNRRVPRGVVVAGLGKRFAAAILDALPLTLLAGLQALVLTLTQDPAVRLVVFIGAGVLSAGYGLYQWWAYASRGAGLGARLMGLRVLSLKDGEPVGWWRFFLRQLIFSALMATVVGGIALLVFLVIDERHQGWHDKAVGAVVIEPRPVEVRPQPARRVPVPSTVGLPPHLSSTFSPQPGTSSGFAPPMPPSQQPSSQPPSRPSYPPGVGAPAAQAPARQAQQPWAQPQPSQPPATMAWQAPLQAETPQASSAPEPRRVELPGADFPGADFPSAEFPGAEFPGAEAPVSPRRPAQSWIPLPTPSSVIEPSRSVRVRKRDFGEVEEDEGTRISAPASAEGRPGWEGWYLRLDDGREVELSVTVLLGRNPQKVPDDPAEVHLVPASGDGRMISRTHVLIGADPRGVFVVDRGSTNGTALVTTGGELEPCPAGTQVRVREGQQVSYGNRWFTVLRRPAAA